jgi:hypothetical protein
VKTSICAGDFSKFCTAGKTFWMISFFKERGGSNPPTRKLVAQRTRTGVISLPWVLCLLARSTIHHLRLRRLTWPGGVVEGNQWPMSCWTHCFSRCPRGTSVHGRSVLYIQPQEAEDYVRNNRRKLKMSLKSQLRGPFARVVANLVICVIGLVIVRFAVSHVPCPGAVL